MGRKLSWLAGIVVVAWVIPAWALSLGNIRVHSRLNQPLTATIPIQAAAGEVIDETVKVRVAANAEYARAGLERLDFLSDLNFTVEGNRVIVNSRKSAREPVIDLLLEVSWGGGRMLRQYTVLLDPEGIGPAPTPFEPSASSLPPSATGGLTSAAPEGRAFTPSPNVGGTRPRTQAQDAPGANAGTAPLRSEAEIRGRGEIEAPESLPQAAARPRTYGPVKPNETPWSVASKLRPDNSVSVEQVVLALFQWNPTAFGSTLTTFRPGATLRVPDIEVIRRVDPNVAKARIAEARSTPAESPEATKPTMTPPNLTPTPPKVAETTPATAEPKIEAVPPRPAEPAPAPKTETAAAPAPAAETAPSGTTPAATEGAPVTAPAETAPSPTSEAAPAAEAPADPAPTPAPVAAEETSEEGGIGDWLLPIGAVLGALVLMFLIWRLVKRPKSPGEDFPSSTVSTLSYGAAGKVSPAATAETMTDAEIAPTAFRTPEPPPAPTRATFGEPSPSPVPQRATAPAAEPPAAPAAKKPSFADTALTDTRQIDLEGGDALAEADFHLAYGLYDEAILLLTQALTRDPTRTDVRVKLAEAYFSANRGQEFMDTARALKDNLDGAGWEKIAVLGRQLFPNDALFGGSGKAPGTPSGEVAVPAPARPAPQPPNTIAFEVPSTPAPRPASAPATSPSDTNAIPFEFEGLDLDSPLDATSSMTSTSANTTGIDLESQVNLDESMLGGDEATTKLDLARAYIDLGDNDMARGLLGEVLQQGTNEQKQAAEELMRKLPA
jgi:pilus assembly protein FimV